ncbi:hypothetical protein [Oleiharenicola lentus]|uniref:hypothetical protein n=1 Tax=Oleiharenicola lentus TaxID=2508720 RepID=UPI003F660D58
MMLSLRGWAAFTVAVVLAVLAPARDAYVLLSGGGTPLTNNYSQYLQAREVAKHLQANYPPDSVWVFFGMGTRPGEPVKLADVRRQVKEKDGTIRETWLPGVLPHNRPARKADFLKALRDEVLPSVKEGGTLYLFIGDHGSLQKKDPKESVVTMWQMTTSGEGKSDWRTNPEEELSVTDLRDALAAGLGKGRVVFCMTQCHSGGFHFIGVPREVLPSTNWFSAVPDWAIPGDEKPLPLAAGFTAVDEESLAAGCDPDPDPDRWAGYERYIPEAWLGVDMFSGKKINAGMNSFAAAHESSVLVDQTIDKPRSTSEQFLERWATVIEKLSADESVVLPEVKARVAAYQAAVDGGFAQADDAAFAAKRAQFERFLERMVTQNTAAASLMKDGTRERLQEAIGPKRPAASATPSVAPKAPAPPSERMILWKDTIRPAWKAAVEAKKVKGLRGEALVFENFLLAQEEKGRNYMFPSGWQNPMLNDLYWRSGYPFPDKLDKKKAEAVTRWGAARRTAILEWAKKSKDPAVSAAGEKLLPTPKDGKTKGPWLPPPRTLSRKIAAERTLFYRRTLAAWVFLIEMKEEAVLAQLHQLIELENTPLPARSE